MNLKIGFIGSGNMAEALIAGFVDYSKDIKNYIFVTDKDKNKAMNLSGKYGIGHFLSNKETLRECDIIFLAIKPNVYSYVLEELKDIVEDRHILVSLAPGISNEYMESFFSKPVKLIRTMPNTPVHVKEGMIVASPNAQIKDVDLEIVVSLLSSVGKVDIIQENLMDAIPAISGSSPAYVYLLIEALADGAVLQGIPRDKAYAYGAQAVLGAAKMVLDTETHPGKLKDHVCSPGGTTIEAIYSLEKSGFRGSIIKAMEACTEKTKRLNAKE
ncbi:pyrroline-5-carboxylate reductase [Serpentinicella sp. ANB-PHB4]|uniref:pyrroline-5-carboxylate reductase n=1 Tax=Serpentinicella sp. ANB-PHB4 TaxID=3074076 RepID=UPI0028563781|nr:pyrroline-5-carboxylate reductase [Serpentinicella sp. ANB-PHB4]MDR5659124.1 pyrroline-5-carboxylate reductase [Serpentinicella sp. ANB-PHB4]